MVCSRISFCVEMCAYGMNIHVICLALICAPFSSLYVLCFAASIHSGEIYQEVGTNILQ